MEITYKFDMLPTAEQVIEPYDNAGLPRPTNDLERIKKMFKNSNLIVPAWGMKINLKVFPAQLQIGLGAVVLPTWLLVPIIKNQGLVKDLLGLPGKKLENNQ